MHAPFLILETGQPVASMRRHGGFPHWIRVAAGLRADEAVAVDVERGEALPSRAGFAGVLVTGSGAMVTDRHAWSEASAAWLRDSAEAGVPVLGICYGVQLMGHFLDGDVEHSKAREYGHGVLTVQKPGRLFAGLPRKLRVWNSHGDKLTKLPPGFRAIGTTENSPFAAIEDVQRNFYGIQFHPEVFHTERGVDMIRNFLLGVCGVKQDWTTRDFITHAVENLRVQVGKGRVILGPLVIIEDDTTTETSPPARPER